MQIWIDFWMLFFWLALFGFLFNPTNFLTLLIYSELIWLTLYCISIICGAVNDEITLVSNTFFILGLAGLEFSIGFLLLVLFKNFNISFFLEKNDKVFRQYIFNNYSLNNFQKVSFNN